MGSFAAQQYVLEHSYAIDGLVLSGSGALDGLVRLTSLASPEENNILNAPFAPARTPFDWLSRDPDGRIYALLPIAASKLMVLQDTPDYAAAYR